MIGTLNSIYFTHNGELPEHVVSNLKQMSQDCLQADYALSFWTDLSLLDNQIKTTLRESGVNLRDYKSITNDILNLHINKFVIQGHSGDICSYAIASDILRVLILDEAAFNDICIYVDCNDMSFQSLTSDLKNLFKRFNQNPLSISFPINECRDSNGAILFVELRNDCIINKKSNNPEFFNEFISKYLKTVVEKSPSYVITTDRKIKKKQADEISSFVTSIPFQCGIDGTIRMGTNNKTITANNLVNFKTYINFQRNNTHGNSWRDWEMKDDLDEIAAKSSNSNKISNHNIFNKNSDKVPVIDKKTNHPFSEYDLNVVYQENDGSFIIKPYTNGLMKISNYGTDSMKINSLIYNPTSNKVSTFDTDNNYPDLLNKIETFINSKNLRR